MAANSSLVALAQPPHQAGDIAGRIVRGTPESDRLRAAGRRSDARKESGS